MKKLLCFSFAMFFAAASSLSAQEIETTFDRDGKIHLITEEMEKKISLFPDVRGFKEAKVFSMPDSTFQLEIVSEMNGKTIRYHRLMRQKDMDTFTQKLDVDLKASAPSMLLDQSGRSDFLLGMATLSLVLYGPTVTAIASPSDAGTAVGLWLLSAGAGYLLPLSATANTPVTKAQSTIALSGAVQGYGIGLVLSDLAGIKDQGALALPLVASISELAILYNIAGASGMSEGKASLIANAGMSGILDGFALGTLADNSHELGTIRELAMVGGHIGGYLAGNLMANGYDYSVGDANAINILATFGYFIGLLNVQAVNTGTPLFHDQSAFLAAAIGNTAGYYIGTQLMKHYDLTVSQGTFVQLGAFGGALIGFGLGYMVDSKLEHPIIPAALASIGSIIGFTGILSSMDRSYAHHKDDTGLNFNINPSGLGQALFASKGNNEPVISMQYKW